MGEPTAAARGRYLLRVEVLELIPRHMLGQAHGLEAERYGTLDNLLQLVLCVARAELARVAMHRESHLVLRCVI